MMSNSLSRLALLVFLLAAAWPASAQEKFQKVLFLGNSITKHGPKADLDWAGNWGMAATAEAKDYVHVVAQGLAMKTGTVPEVMVKNIADFERGYAGYNATEKLAEATAFRADLIIVAIGENVPALKTAEDAAAFQSSVRKLLIALKADRTPRLVVRSCFWANAAKDEALKQACAAAGGVFVDLSTLGKDESNYARSERPYKHAGVANHPGDKGMEAIAAALLKALSQ